MIARVSLLTLALVMPVSAATLRSPDRRMEIEVGLRDFDGRKGCPVYRVRWGGREIIADSRLGMELEDGLLGEGLEKVREVTSKHDSTWEPVCGERSGIRDRYNGLVIEFEGRGGAVREFSIEVRAYDEGVAWRYVLPKASEGKGVAIRAEQTEFRFGSDHEAWAVYSAQGKYAKVKLSEIKKGCERPLVVRLSEDCYAALGEAALVDHARMKFASLAGAQHALVSSLDGPVEGKVPLATPWRFVMAAKTPGALLENNFLILNLNEPCAIGDTSWIRPGKVIREATLTTAGGKACVDFAVKRNLQYIEFDAGWYGNEYDDASDARAVNLDPKRSKGPLDLTEVIAHAKSKGIGVILYVNRRALEKQLDEILPLYQRWGVAGVKYGFVNVGSQKWTAWLHEAIRKAAAHRLMVDVHDEYRTTGYERTYPNLMTVEGIGGDETTPEPEQTLTLQFARFIAGPADNTVCYFDGRVNKMSSHAYQLAKPVCLYSPWQFLFWYDRPAAAGDDPELEFWDRMPTTWDETRVLDGRIGEFSAIARRSGGAWFVGCMNGPEARELSLKLDFLESGKRYTASIYSDDPSMDTRTHVRVERRPVDATTVLKPGLAARGGQAIHIAPEKR
ncbi:MAG TPA: glycoside hydrolase family 97 N-terminal domain-containing protein [Verrucomicrobiae bacterium]|nr:glycoside hydrolase family 97 N-terminal domain-containing protein [Verrucomicrobiae bacterium]